MKIGIPREIKTAEFRVGLTPAGASELVSSGHQVIVEHGAGARIGFDDDAYARAGASLAATPEQVFAEAELIVKVKEPQPAECELIESHHTLFTFLHLAALPALTRRLCDSGATCVAYETVTDERGGFPLLTPMSEVAGRLSIQAAAWYLQAHRGGKGLLLAGVPGVAPGRVVILGGGVVGRNAALMAIGLGADVTIIDRNAARMRELETAFANRIRTVHSSPEQIVAQLHGADVVVGAVLVAGDAAPKLVDRQMLGAMEAGSVIVDVAIDQGGCFETSRPTTHEEPVYVEEGILHYCVANMPGAVPRTSTLALTNVTLPRIRMIADQGIARALEADEHLRAGLNVFRGEITHAGVANALGLEYCPPLDALIQRR